jgi:metal-dependent amidase/aminoacylase/carboxypeptidase family protein
MRGQVDMKIVPGSGVVFNDAEVVNKMANIAKSVLGSDMVAPISEPVMGGEDFSAFLETAKGAFFFHNGSFGDERDMPHHNPKFQLNESSFWSGTAAMAAFALYWQR